MSKKHFLLVLICVFSWCEAQKNFQKHPDSLKRKSYEYLDDKIYELRNDSARSSVYMFEYLRKAKFEKNYKEIINGYQNLLHESPHSMRLIYADSMIYTAKKTNDKALIGSAYLSKGIVYYLLKKQNNALDNFITADSYISQTTDKYLIYKLKYHIALVKYYLGYYDEAISLLRECTFYFKSENSRAYLNSLHSLGLCYNRLGNYGLCSQTNALGLVECEKLDIREMEVYFIHSQGINDFFQKNYASAIKSIESSIEELKEKKDFGNESVGYFYIGKSYWEVRQYEKALPYFEKVDQLFNARGYLRTDQREMYEVLIKYYKNQENRDLQLYYIDQLLKADKVLNETFKYLVGKINKEYNTQELMFEKQSLKNELVSKNFKYSVLTGFTSLLFLSFVVLTYRYYKNRKIYRQKFDEQMLQISASENKTKQRQKIEKPVLSDINPETVSLILNQLEKFEIDKKFLEKDWSLSKLSAAFKSNPTYLSSIIRHYKEKGFTEYINDLKIDYVMSLLYNDKLVRNYTNKALAAEVGFSSTQRFVKAFKSKTGMPTFFFIEQIKRKG
ncbi:MULTISPECIES: helix-turn-helix domain-containing protein [Flavobacterium]|uniref:Helix-turn-helix protein n=1 Tax=Flavobacterium cutihirudinis TaxID=1265740 RepID=A0A3D9G1B4_9FLAO|nr:MULTISPECIES: helix-turn-helix domain-containing protein [Flavobacterium]MBZ4040952.1 helix-turn-helix domain-containing protein [Flavobacterium hibisci]RED27016.1 helix-turn-helix protein [Flavobacterium cutihirudinis]